MATLSGTASNHTNLLERFITFVTTNISVAENWTTLASNTASPTFREYYLQAPGLSGTEQININFRAYESTSDNAYNWLITGALGYLSTSDIQNQPSTSPSVIAHLSNQAIPFYFYANGQRAIVHARVGTIDILIYVGKILPTGTSGQFPNPILISATGGINSENNTPALSNINFDMSSFISPGLGTYFYAGDSGWIQIRNRSNVGSVLSTGLFMSPTCFEGFFIGGANQWTRTATDFTSIQQLPNGGDVLLPFDIITFNESPSRNYYGQLDGVYWVTGIGKTTGNTITESSRTFRVFQNMNRSVWPEHCAIEEI